MDIDVSKENIQPLRGGRNLAQLGTALQAQSDHDAQRQLQLQKEEHEAAISHYQGSDPLDPWFNYIQWVEQSFPKHGHEGQIDKLIKDCLQLFEKDVRYKQDRRFVKLWIKYIDCLTNPLEIYQRLYSSGIGVECSEFYRAWACYCEESGDYKRANQVYMLGLQAKAQPLDELEQAHMNFQLFFAQRMLHDDSPTKRKAASALAETRMALTSLKTFKRRNIATAPVQRIGDNIKSVGPGVISQHGQNDKRVNAHANVKVYEDLPSTSRVPVPGAEIAGPSSLVQTLDNVENEREIGIWTNAKTKMVYTNVVPHQNLPFTPYEDEDVLKLSANHMSYCKDDLTFPVALCIPDPPDASKKPCYNKIQVYVDNIEYSLEEIKARNYHVDKKPKTEKQEHIEIYQDQSDVQAAQCSALETLANCALDAEHDHLSQLMPLSIPAVQNIKVQNIHSPGEPKVLVNLDSKEFSELANPSVKKSDENRQPFGLRDKENLVEKPVADDTYSNDNNAQNYGRNQLAEEFNKSLMNNLLGDSVTVNTKEARWELRNLFNDNAVEPSMVQPVVQQFEIPKFDIHEDRSITIAMHTKKRQVLQEVVESSPPEDKENAKFTTPLVSAPPNVNRTAYYDEPSCTQVFNYNINGASTPNTSQFKKPTSYTEQSKGTVPKFILEESVVEQGPIDVASIKKEESSHCEARAEQHPTMETQGGGLSVIMEATREYNSKSGSSSSGRQSTRNNFTGYTTTPYGEKTQGSNYDSMYNHQHEAATSKRNSISNQPRLANGQFARIYPQKHNDNKVATPSASIPYLSHDHQYQKPMPQPYNGYSAQRSIQNHGYQQNYGASYQQGYSNSQMGNQQSIQQCYPSPSYQSPQHSMQSPHQVPSPTPQPGFQSPPHHYAHQQVGYNSPGHQVQNSPQHYSNTLMRQDYGHVQAGYANQDHRHVYANPPQAPAAFQSPPHPSQYSNTQYYQRTNTVNAPANSGYSQQNYSVQNQYNMTSSYENQNLSHQNFNTQGQYRQQQIQMPENSHRVGYGIVVNNSSFQIYQSPTQPSHNNYTVSGNVQNTTFTQDKCQPMITSSPTQQYTVKETSHIDRQENQVLIGNNSQNPEVQSTTIHSNAGTKQSPQGQQMQHKNPTSALRSIRHEQPHVKTSQNSPDIGFSNQFLNFISGRNEPKDNANTPKFNNSPSISQKMHKNLYVSSPEQAQIPPSTGSSDSESKDGLTARTITPIQSAKVSSQLIDKQKDLSKRQLDFEHRMEVQSEDSRDSMSKESRISSIYSRQSDFQSDGYGMDIDSENSMECTPFKSMHTISQLETSDIARPAEINFPSVIDPFNKKIINSLLEYVKFPNKTHAEGYIEVRSIPKLQVATLISVGGNRFSIEKQLGKGNYGAVFLCLDMINNKSVAIKYQKPGRPWEFYICQEIKARIKDPFMLPGYMDISTAFLGDNASLFVSEYSKYGSLLDVANKVRVATSKCINEFIVFLLTSEMLSIIHYLHKAQIIHADIKPDNFLLMKIPTQEWRTPSLQLIDLGCAIDMSLFPEDTTFRELITTEGFTCTEMRESKPWTYQTDLYCLAGTIHVILMGSYMKVVNRLGQWNIDKKLPRYMKVSLWDKIFTTLLNVPDCNTLPDLMDLKNDVDNLLCNVDNLGSHLRNFANVLKSR